MMQHLIAAGAAVIFGYLTFLFILKLLPGRLKESNTGQKKEIMAEAKRQAENIRKDAAQTELSKLQLVAEELEEQIKQRGEDLKLEEEAIKLREQSLQSQENRMKKIEKDSEDLTVRVKGVWSRHKDILSEQEKLETQKVTELAKVAKADTAEIIKNLRDQMVESRQLEVQKTARLQQEELQNSMRRTANRFMSRALNRYAPEFYWPKMVNHVDLTDQKQVDALNNDASFKLLANVKEIVGIEAELLLSEKINPPVIKLAGGMGADRESARLALTEVIQMDPRNWDRFPKLYEKHREAIKLQALRLGKQAIRELKLNDIHTEIQLLIGYLNWRTSYRQNQFLHSLEVAKLAGIVAFEVGVDPQDARRCGLLHDIGKVLDYRIEGSHAVISGDYADRFGEKRFICDALMSHHNDLVVETPLAYVLKTADTLSGARPGARVNLEEGYQVRLSAIDDVVRSFPGIMKSIIMNGGREVHIEVNHRKISDDDLQALTTAIAKKIEVDVAFPGQIKVLVTRRFESSAVA